MGKFSLLLGCEGSALSGMSLRGAKQSIEYQDFGLLRRLVMTEK